MTNEEGFSRPFQARSSKKAGKTALLPLNGYPGTFERWQCFEKLVADLSSNTDSKRRPPPLRPASDRLGEHRIHGNLRLKVESRTCVPENRRTRNQVAIQTRGKVHHLHEWPAQAEQEQLSNSGIGPTHQQKRSDLRWDGGSSSDKCRRCCRFSQERRRILLRNIFPSH
jgi:hypothetical protein